jgi:hypothetical protein
MKPLGMKAAFLSMVMLFAIAGTGVGAAAAEPARAPATAPKPNRTESMLNAWAGATQRAGTTAPALHVTNAGGPQPLSTTASGVDTIHDPVPIDDCHGDITTYGGAYTAQAITMSLNTLCGSNPVSAANWTIGLTDILWGIDLNGDDLPEFAVMYLNDGGLTAVVLNTTDLNNPFIVCGAAPAWDGNAGFSATFSASCIGNPSSFRMAAFMQWDEAPFAPTCFCPEDEAPNGGGFIGPIDAPLGDGPGVASATPGTEDVFARGQDNGLWSRHFNGATWGAWFSLGGIITGAPAAASSTTGALDVFVRGQDTALWSRHFNGATWGAWYSLGGILSTAPAAVSSGPGILDVLVAGQDRALWVRHFSGISWGAWSNLGGILNREPAAASSSTGTIDVFASGQDNALWSRHFNGMSWEAWYSLGGLMSSGPSAASAAAHVIDVFVMGVDGALWSRHFNGASWSGWIGLGGALSSPPAAASDGPGLLDVFIRGVDSALWTRHATSGVWSPWTSLGGVIL